MATSEEPRVFLAWCYEVAPGQMALLTQAEVERRGLRTGKEIQDRIGALTEELRQARDWEDVADGWTEAIKEAHPTRIGSHKAWSEAMKMVGHRHSKGELVALVNWLLLRLQRFRGERHPTDSKGNCSQCGGKPHDGAC